VPNGLGALSTPEEGYLLRPGYSEAMPDTWTVLQATVEGQPLIALVNTAYASFPDKASFPWSLLISMDLVKPTAYGLSEKDESDELERLQQEVMLPAVGATGPYHFVARTTHAGRRDMLLYVAEPWDVIQALDPVADSIEDRHVTFGCTRDDEWQIVARYLSPPKPRPRGFLSWLRREG
jgi:hypothetical protein